MNKKLVAILTLCMVLCLSFGAFACAGTPNDKDHEHNFNGRRIDSEYLASKATCTEKAKYYYSCDCGEKDTETFDHGTVLDHDYGDWISNGNNTHSKTCSRDNRHVVTENCSGGTASYTQKAICSVCNEKYGDFLATEGLKFTLINNNTEYSVTDYTGTSTEVYIPTTYSGLSVTSIGDYAFENCSSLTSIRIPNTVTSFGYNAFSGCDSLVKVNYIGTIDQWVEIDFEVDEKFSNIFSNPLYYTKDLYINNKLVTDINITTATKIKDLALLCCSSLKSVTIGNRVNSIGKFNFALCDSLISVIIGDNVEVVDDFAFMNCVSLSNLIFGNKLTSIGNNAFSACVFLSSITIPKRVTNIHQNAFSFCIRLVEVINKSQNIIIDNKSIDQLGYYTLSISNSDDSYVSKVFIDRDGFIIYNDGQEKILVGNNGLKSDLIIGSSVQEMGIDDINIPKTDLIIPEGITKINQYAFYQCSSLTSIIIPDSVTSIGHNAFYECSSLQYNEKDGLKYLGNDNNKYLYLASTVSTDITTANIDSNCKFIGEWAFLNCDLLTSVIIPDSVTSIGWDAFFDCDLLQTIYCEAESLPSRWSSGWKDGCDAQVVWGYKG